MSMDKTMLHWVQIVLYGVLGLQRWQSVGWELENACTDHVYQSGTSVSSTCSVCPGSLPLQQGAWCHSMQEFMLSSETVAPVCIQHMFSHEKAHCRLAFRVS